MDFHFQSIGSLSTCFKEKFGIPRQSGLVAEASGILKLNDDPSLKSAVYELEGFSHIWVIFVFHQLVFHEQNTKNWKPSIRPPRLGGARKVGVLASRSPHRPNPIGLSVVKLEQIDFDAPGGVELYLKGVDILDGSPVLDIKPYLYYADSISNSISGWADEPILRTPVEFSEVALLTLETINQENYPNLKKLITQMLELDPRPASQKRKISVADPENEGAHFGIRILDFDVKWQLRDGKFFVTKIETVFKNTVSG